MSEVWRLTKLLYKNETAQGPKKKKALRALLTILVVVFGLLPLFFMFFGMYSVFFSLRLKEYAFFTSFFATSIFAMFTVIVSFPSAFYFAKDNKTLLTWPLKPSTIVLSKMLLQSMYVYLEAIVIEGPLLLAYVLVSTFRWSQFFILLLQCLLVPMGILLTTGIVVMLLMRFMPLFANKDRFNLIIGIIAVFFTLFCALGGQMLGQSAGADDLSAITGLFTNNPQMYMTLSGFFFQAGIGANAAAHQSLPWTLASIAVFALLLALFVLCANKLWIPAALSANVNSASKKAVAIKENRPDWNYFKTEMKKILRSPAYLANSVISPFIMPVMVIVLLLVNPEIGIVRQMSLELDLTALMPFWALMLMFGMVWGFFCGGLNGLSSTAISREGQNLYFIKTIPMSMKTQLRLKLLPGLILSLVPCLVYIPLFHYFFNYSPVYDLLYLAGLILASVLINQLGLAVDMIRPKLVWDDETAAVKNNLNILFELLGSWLLAVVYAIPIFLFWDHWQILAAVLPRLADKI
jgi:hypothetical protein